MDNRGAEIQPEDDPGRRLRDEFLLDPSIVFLNHGSFGACPKDVLDAYQGWQREMEKNPVEFLGRRSAALLSSARESLAEYLGARAEDLVFVSNATTGVNTVARSLSLAEGDEILTTDHEYGACDNTWEFVCERTGARLVRVEIPLPFAREDFVERVLSGVTPRTRLLFLSHVTSTTALIFPIAEVCKQARDRGILTLIDGAHVPGQLPLDVESLGADFYTGNCHKWLCAPKGAAFLHVRPERQKLIDATVISWGYSSAVTGHAGFEAYTGKSLLERRLQWQGTRDIAAFLAVPKAIEFQRAHGWDHVRERCHGLIVETRSRLQEMTGLNEASREDDFAQMAVLPVPSMKAEELKETLFARFRIEIPVTSHKNQLFVRLSIQGYNTRADAGRLLEALGEIFHLDRRE
ncbi:MAG: aminotransferase class V-fold PLP-dependent enzyme [Acidobacteria bacterium]|nr:aminotransferase class V-fold PLP-dependent enzyme [Acidobacteriota bacterium]MCG3192819.1 Isopenicillin N epimerase [Thermoanaerobaculia bacterium]